MEPQPSREEARNLSDDELFDLLTDMEDTVPRTVVDEILERQERLRPRLMAVASDMDHWDGELGDSWLPEHAAFLLGAMATQEVDEPLLCAMRYASELGYGMICEAMPSILGRRGARIRPALFEIARDRQLDPFLRDEALRGLAATTLHDAADRDQIFALVAEIFHDTSESLLLRGLAGTILLDFQITNERETLLAFARDFEASDEEDVLFEEEDVEAAFEGSPDVSAYDLDWLEFYSEEAIVERGLEEDDEEDFDCGDPDCTFHEHLVQGEHNHVPVRVGPKVGRNDPCPCGSGSKYKKCCGA